MLSNTYGLAVNSLCGVWYYYITAQHISFLKERFIKISFWEGLHQIKTQEGRNEKDRRKKIKLFGTNKIKITLFSTLSDGSVVYVSC